ncbi:hypothetical protein, conserved [Eimeria tenella]|uniref:SPRY domain-containing protein n=1 Tax=Eimeria tenella TaxID=5802 RepID=U6KUJ6_EIMTE|nr:hypothetical protein, conserved [Eimeria tenella]CDJ41631.1 hypothetical protein, conserved [Eimeria tenella]|eukprot:XP_013232381.1 hypothetical protein, conserved [Eimeria tenella]
MDKLVPQQQEQQQRRAAAFEQQQQQQQDQQHYRLHPPPQKQQQYQQKQKQRPQQPHRRCSKRSGSSTTTIIRTGSSSTSSRAITRRSSKTTITRSSTTTSPPPFPAAAAAAAAAAMSGELHPHDQHGRHGTHCIVPHGAKERSQVEETLRRAKLPPLSLARDDFPSVVLSERYRDRRIKLDQDRLICEGHKGWSSVFATHACSSGCYFFEVEALSPKTDTLHFAGYPPDMQPRVHPYFRVGWACRYQRFDLPIGSNSFSYAISDFDKISVVHEARREQLLSDVNIKVGDVIGCSICIPEPAEWPPDPREDSKLYEFLLGKQQLQQQQQD